MRTDGSDSDDGLFDRVELDEDLDSFAPIQAAEGYYLKADHLPSGRSELIKQVALLFVCLSGAYLYFAPAEAYAERENEENLKWAYVVGTCFPAIVVLYNATDTFFKVHMSSVIPRELRGVLKKPQTSGERFAENFGIGFLSLLSSIPLATVVFAYPPADVALGWLIAMSAVVLVDNTILHFLPVKLVLNQKIYRFPILPFEYFFKFLYTKCIAASLTDLQNKQKKYDRVKAADQMALKQSMIQRVAAGQAAIMQQAFKWNWRRLAFDITAPVFSEDAPLATVLDAIPAAVPKARAACLTHLNTGARKTFALIGAFWMWACCAGYYAQPYNQFVKWTGSDGIAAASVTLPVYNISALLSFFGVHFAHMIYDYLTDWSGGVASKVPIAFKLFPKLFTLLMIGNVAMARFSYAAATELVYSNFTYDWAEPILPYLVNISMSGLAFLGFMATRDFVSLIFQKYAMYFGSEQMKSLIRANERVEQYKNSALYMDGDQLERELDFMQGDELQKISGMDHSELGRQKNHTENFKTWSANNNKPWWSCFPCAPKVSGDASYEPIGLMDGIKL